MGLRKNLETKKAQIVGESPSSIPGSEHDSRPPESAKAPDKESKDQSMVPNSGLTTAGAGDDSKITHTNDLKAGQPALVPQKKPEVTGDADASVPGGKTAEELGAEILSDVDGWFKAQKAAENDAPKAGAGTGEALITDKGKEPDQTKPVIAPDKKPEVSTDALAPATGEGSSGETAAAAKAAKAAETAKEGECCKDGKCGKCAKCKAAATKATEPAKESECCKDGKCGKCAKCKAAAEAAKKAAETVGGLNMELTSDVLAKIAAVMLATEEGTKLAETTLAKAAGAEAAEKTLAFLRAQNELAQKQAEYEAGQRDAAELIAKMAQEADDSGEGGSDDEVEVIADTLDEMINDGTITEEQADQLVLELADAIGGGDTPDATSTADAAGATTCSAKDPAKCEQKEEKTAGQSVAELLIERITKKAQEAAPAATGDAVIDQTVAVPPEQLSADGLPEGDLSDITPEMVADVIDQLVASGEITEEEANALVDQIVGGDGAASPEDIATALQEAIQNGTLKPEDVSKVLAELEGQPAPEEAAAAAPGGADQAAAAEETATAGTQIDGQKSTEAQQSQAPEQKTAAEKLLAAINAARTAKPAETK